MANTATNGLPVQVVAEPNGGKPSEISVDRFASYVAANPSVMVNSEDGTSLTDRIKDPSQTGTAAQVNPNNPNLSLGQQDTVQAGQVAQQTPTEAHGYETTKTEDKVADNQMQGAQGTVSDNAQIKDIPQADTTGIATGVNKDGSVNELGQSLKEYAKQDMSTIIDTSTSAGKLLAQQLGDGNYVDSKATLQGQLAILQDQFVDPSTGEPKIPSWAAATARNVGKIAAFSGMTGTAATAAMSQALLEASLPIAQQDAQFFQTLTVKNLDNKQQSTINAANVLAKFEQTNLDNRMTAAVQNAQAFLAMDMKNLDNEQQAAVINNQSRIQSILADANAENVKNQFMAESQNDIDKFYASLNTQISQFNSSQTLDADKFNSTMEDSRQKFYSDQQYNIAVANANWRQQVQLQDDQQKYEAATTDVKNMLDISLNQLNQLWDRSDALLDYAWKSSENAKDRAANMAIEKLKGKGADKAALGSLAGAFVGSKTFENMMGNLF
ncbi:hypothetical protein F67_I3_11_089 [Rhizobium phage RHph_I3_11]|nr:hypothetical protein F67_I3_11_089 [Rhizobium phage RHph_I3_11]